MERGMTLEERLRRLEAEVEEHGRELGRLRFGGEADAERAVEGCGFAAGEEPVAVETGASGGVVWDRTPGGPWPALRLPRGLAGMRRWEWWMNKVGIALFLMGVVFLFRFSWERGWLQVLLTPEVRVGLGLFLGSALVWAGLRVYARRRAFAQVVLGGGIATYYITGFAAYRMLDVVGHPVAFAFMVAVTLLAFVLALRQDGAVLAVIGVSGGLATPFLLYEGEANVSGLVLYLCIVVAGAMGAYLHRGWPQLLLVAAAGYWAALLVGHAGAGPAGPQPHVDLLALQAGVLFGWASLWLVPVTREALREADPGRWPATEPGAFTRAVIGESGTPARLLSFAAPAIGLWFTQHLWDPGRTEMGVVVLGVAATHGLAWAGFRRVAGGRRVAYTQAIVALLLSTLAMAFLLEGEALLLGLAAEAAALHVASRRLSDQNLPTIAHGLFLLVGLWLLGRLAAVVPYGSLSDTPVVGAGALADIAVLALILAASRFVNGPKILTAYRVAVHAGMLAWCARELVVLPGASDAYVTLAWGMTGAAMFVAGLRLDHGYLIRGGIVTLFLVVAKLLVWDLSGLDAAWRILLFLGFGGMFLVLGYHLRNLWNPRQQSLEDVLPDDLGSGSPSLKPDA